MSGNATPSNPSEWLDLVEIASDRVVGQITRDGRVRSDDPEIIARVESAWDRSLLADDGEVIEELGVCFAGIDTIEPGDPAHNDLVFRNLGILTGLIPRPPDER